MAKTIGAQSFDIFLGTVAGYVAGTDTFERPGVDGRRIRQIGLRGVDAELQTVNYVTGVDDAALAAVVAAKLDALAVLVGTLVTIVDAHGISRTLCRIIDHTPAVSTVIHEGAKAKRVACRWTIRKEPA